jgi:hypothetical protein
MMTTEQKVVIPTAEEILKPEAEVVQETAPELSEAEKIAAEQGWVPKNQWKGNPDDWRPAKEFNDRGELFTRIKAQSKELQELRHAMTFLTEQQKKQFDAGFQQAVRDLKTARDAALQEGDVFKAQQITDKLDDVKDQHRAQQAALVKPAPVTPEPSPTFRAWFEQNSWYTKDKVLTKYADAVGYEYKTENPESTEADMLAHVAKNVKKEFPHKFQVRGAPSPDGEGRESPRGPTESTSGYKSIENNMTDEQRSIMKTILKSTGMTKEQYFKQYAG